MRSLVVFAVTAMLASAQPQDAAFQQMERAYAALRSNDYDVAVPAFLAAIAAAPARAGIRMDLAYTYLKIGEPELARVEFREAMRLDSNDTAAALEYAFLCYETKLQAEARRVFDRLRRTGNATAEQAFHNIDDPLASGIERWRKAIEAGADNFSGHFELATLAEQRDDLSLAATHFERAWRLLPDRRTVLVDLGRVWQTMGRKDDATAALLAASWGGEPRAAEMARELLPARYPFVNEFRKALALDPGNHDLRRELGYLLLRMGRESEAEAEFRVLAQNAPDDLLSATQLGFLLYARGERFAAQPLFDRVLAGADDDLANRVRAVLRLPQVLRPRAATATQSIDAKTMAERSIKAGYMKDALKYLEAAHEDDTGDFDVMRKLAWTYNILHRDAIAWRWFDLARRSPDPTIAADAEKGFKNLRGAAQRFRTTAWLYPLFSSRWNDLFVYGQIKTAINLGLPVQPYVSVRFVGDTRRTVGAISPQYLSESSFILAVGAATRVWHGVTAWGEAGTAISYLKGHMLPDYRGGVSGSRTLRREGSAWLVDTSFDALFISRFDHDFLVYGQSRAGYDFGTLQLHWNGNATVDAKRQDWANFVETGPGLRVPVAQSMYLTFNLLRGAYLIANPSRPSMFNDVRAGFWYAFTR
ncbi:MAG: tetratricopeptide repeat protein [Candidatus Solibacter sp.]